jgi:hypothetical protein
MSIIIKKTFFILFASSFFLSYSQEQKERKYVTIYIDNLKDKALKGYSISNDTTSAQFSIYAKGFESKANREKAIREYYQGPENSNGEPTFIITFTAFAFKPVVKPERLKSLNGITYITLKELRDKNYVHSSPTYIIHKLKDGTYLKWETITLD